MTANSLNYMQVSENEDWKDQGLKSKEQLSGTSKDNDNKCRLSFAHSILDYIVLK